MKTVFLFLFIPILLPAQDLTGVWTGYIISGENKLPYEIAISRNNNELTGFAMIVFSIDGVKNVGLKTVKLKEKKGRLSIEDDKLLYDNYSIAGKRVILKGDLGFKAGKNAPVLSGSFFTRTVDIRQRGNPSYSGTIELSKKIEPRPSEILGVLRELDLLGSLSFLAPEKIETPITNVADPSRSKVASVEIRNEPVTLPPAAINNLPELRVTPRRNEIMREINFRSDSLTLTLYDNGEIDGDTVTVLLNGRVLMNKKGLTSQPIRQTVYTTPELGDSILIVMYAENLGVYPPNTGLLIIQDGDQRWQVNFVGDFQKNSAVVLRRRR
jgi:hypothetical protein